MYQCFVISWTSSLLCLKFSYLSVIKMFRSGANGLNSCCIPAAKNGELMGDLRLWLKRQVMICFNIICEKYFSDLDHWFIIFENNNAGHFRSKLIPECLSAAALLTIVSRVG